jgi:flagellin-like protein
MNNMKRVVNKRGLSPVVASALLILLVLVLASIIFLWARGFIGDQVEKFGEPIEDSCRGVSFEVARINNGLEVLNKGDVDIRYLEIRMSKEGDSNVKRFDFSVDAQEFKSDIFSFSMSDDEVIDPDTIIVYPALVGNVVGKPINSVYVCLDSGVML